MTKLSLGSSIDESRKATYPLGPLDMFRIKKKWMFWSSLVLAAFISFLLAAFPSYRQEFISFVSSHSYLESSELKQPDVDHSTTTGKASKILTPDYDKVDTLNRDKRISKVRVDQPTDLPELSDDMRRAVDAFVGISDRDMPETKVNPVGGYTANLNGRYRHVTVVRLTPDGDLSLNEYGPSGIDKKE